MKTLLRCMLRLSWHVISLAPQPGTSACSRLKNCFNFNSLLCEIVKPLKRLARLPILLHRAGAAVLMRCGRKACGLALLPALFVLPSKSLAHRLDEYLQATLVSIEPGEIRLQINLTPGVAVAEQVLALVDSNHDGVISTNEANAYSELMKRDLLFRLDQRKVALKPTASNFPAPAELGTGLGIIQLEFSATIEPLAAGAHKLTLKNRHLPTLSVYLFNAAKSGSGSVQITRQKRSTNQSTGVIDFTISRG